jgi:hypothetical protein
LGEGKGEEEVEEEGTERRLYLDIFFDLNAAHCELPSIAIGNIRGYKAS